MVRICPHCKKPLEPLCLPAAPQLDFCPVCCGLWFDRKELAEVCRKPEITSRIVAYSRQPQRPAASADQPALPPLLLRMEEGAGPERPKRPAYARLCPVCRTPLNGVRVADQFDADRCLKCRGVWLDGGELALLFEQYARDTSASLTAAATSPPPPLSSSLPPPVVAGAAARGAGGKRDLVDAADLLIWGPDLLHYAGEGLGQAAANLPGVAADGLQAALGAAAHVPDLAAGAAGTALHLAAGAADVAGHAAGSAADLLSAFLEACWH